MINHFGIRCWHIQVVMIRTTTLACTHRGNHRSYRSYTYELRRYCRFYLERWSYTYIYTYTYTHVNSRASFYDNNWVHTYTTASEIGSWNRPSDRRGQGSEPRPQYAFKWPMFSVSCNSHWFTQLAAFFIDPRAEWSTALSYNIQQKLYCHFAYDISTYDKITV